MENINIPIVKNNAKNCKDAVTSLRTSAANFSGELENLSSAWSSTNAKKAEVTMNAIMSDLDSILVTFNSINDKINQVASDIEIVEQTNLENQSTK